MLYRDTGLHPGIPFTGVNSTVHRSSQGLRPNHWSRGSTSGSSWTKVIRVRVLWTPCKSWNSFVTSPDLGTRIKTRVRWGGLVPLCVCPSVSDWTPEHSRLVSEKGVPCPGSLPHRDSNEINRFEVVGGCVRQERSGGRVSRIGNLVFETVSNVCVVCPDRTVPPCPSFGHRKRSSGSVWKHCPVTSSTEDPVLSITPFPCSLNYVSSRQSSGPPRLYLSEGLLKRRLSLLEWLSGDVDRVRSWRSVRTRDTVVSCLLSYAFSTSPLRRPLPHQT